MTVEEKLEMADALVALGVDIIEAGFPGGVSRRFRGGQADRAAGQGCRRRRTGPRQRKRYRAGRAMPSDAPTQSRVHTFIATSDIHLKHKLRMTREQVLERAAKMVAFAKTFTSDVEFSAEDATRSDRDFLVQVFTAAIKAGATTINVPDTVGYTTPGEYRGARSSTCAAMSKASTMSIISVHCHNDLGMATANTLAAIAAGARQIEVPSTGSANGPETPPSKRWS